MKTVTREAHAKINLFLEVQNRRPDGYHNISTVMQSVSLCDTVTVSAADGDGISVFCTDPRIGAGKENLAYRAAQEFLSYSGQKKAVDIKIEKRIPVSAGLAGGSTDAAAVILALNELCDNPLDMPALLKIGKDIGADVPFCITGGAALCEGIGDIITPCKPLPPCSIVIAVDKNAKISTPTAYSVIDSIKDRVIDKNRMPEKLSGGNMFEICNAMYNAFEIITPLVYDLKKQMMSCGALVSMMSGSGPSVFGIFEDEEKAIWCIDELTDSGYLACMG